ncbi:MAG: NUDIX domain-containing protein [Rhizobiales bacterium]|nr:NUDIX domain-containing protein [Hyphomicrobiales bacterium]
MIKKLLFKALSRPIIQPAYRQFRGLTIGTRTVVFDAGGQVLLVRHSYSPGWQFPGGGVERGETVYAAAIRELREEAAVEALETPVLYGIFDASHQFPGDHVCCFIVRNFTRGDWKPSSEIADARFFATSSIPEDATNGTKRRLAEIAGGAEISPFW